MIDRASLRQLIGGSVARAGLFAFVLASQAAARDRVSFPTEDGGLIYADLYGKGDRGVVLAHGGRFNKESWKEQAEALAASGFRVLAIDFRGDGESRGPGQTEPMSAPLYLDVLGAVRYLRKTGAKSVSVVGGSMGASAAADASIRSRPGEIDRLVLLAGSPDGPSEQIKSSTLFVIARADTSGSGPRLPGFLAAYEKAPQPKKLLVLNGSAHAQYLFKTDQGDLLMREILKFLSEP